MRRLALGLVALGLLIALSFWVARHAEPPRAPEAAAPLPEAPATDNAARQPAGQAASAPRPNQGQPASAVATVQPPQPAPPLSPPDPEALLEVDKVNLMIRDYRSLAGENPVGTNAEIMASVTGDNPKQAKLGPPEGMSLNEKGELIDRWGTPYFFHQLSRDHMEIRSAGADRVMWTDDDPVAR